MKVGLIDLDGHNFPNLPLMKLAAYHKTKGDSVEWYEPLFSGHMDRVYMRKCFLLRKTMSILWTQQKLSKVVQAITIRVVEQC